MWDSFRPFTLNEISTTGWFSSGAKVYFDVRRAKSSIHLQMFVRKSGAQF
jgi:hypothetical protein